MKYINLPDSESRKLPFYLAMEEYVAEKFSCDSFFMWQVAPTVIFGRNQVMESEVNLAYCRRHGIQVYRRKSGGGCVYADLDNIMFSYIVPEDSASTVFSAYTSQVASMLKAIGIPAHATGRNDIFIGDRKVSGNAFYHIPGHSIVHGTMLYSTDIEAMVKALSPSPSKLESKGVDSVRSHITTLREHTSISIEEFKAHVREYMCDGVINLTEKDVEKIEELSQHYYTPEWIYGKNPRFNRRISRRIEGVGEFLVELAVNRGRIESINLTGDFFQLGDIDSQLLDHLKGAEYSPEGIRSAIAGIATESIISGLENENLINLIYNNHE